MESTLTIGKRQRDSDFSADKCLICQEDRRDDFTRDASAKGLATLKEALTVRTLFNCEKYTDAIEKLHKNQHIIDNQLVQLVYHKGCFSSFTSKDHLERLKKRHGKVQKLTCEKENAVPSKGYVSRRTIPPVKWELCIFCQEGLTGGLRQVLTLETSDKIHKNKDCNFALSCRLAGITDLVAAKAKYHLRCYSKFQKTVAKTESSSTLFPSVLDQTCFKDVMDELKTGLQNGKVFTVKTVWESYIGLVRSMSDDNTGRTDSNLMRCFRNEIQRHFGDRIEYVAQNSKQNSLLIFPTLEKNCISRKLIERTEELEVKDTECKLLNKIPKCDIDKDIIKSIYYVGTEIRSELKSLPSHNSYDGIDRNHVEKLVPPNLFLLLSVILGCDENDESHDKIFSLAQDIIYVASRGKTLTPKHVGLGSTIHHATRSKSLVQLLNAAGHCASYETVEKTVTSIAKDEVGRWEANGRVFIPPNLEHGHFTQFAGDNINITVETLDGKGMFNATQYVAFQHGASDKSSLGTNDTRDIGTQRSFGPFIPPGFHDVSSSGYSKKQRPTPIIPVNSPELLQSQCDAVDLAKAKDLAWLLCRSSNTSVQKVPSWTGFNHIVSPFESEISTVGHMPIIPFPADDMDTVYTVLSRCKAVSEKLGQTYTVVTFDQALYCRAKELVWLKNGEFDNVIIRLGGFHTVMNFLKAIGQHMESSGLKDVWIESGIYGENTASHIMNGHAYNKAVRAHKLTLEALWRILCPMFQEWASLNGKEPDNEITAAVEEVVNKVIQKDESVINSFNRLVEASSELLDLLKEFDKIETAATFRYWRHYMEMVSVVLGFIRAEREGNWALHLELFAKMLPWFAVYDHYNYSRWGPVYLADMRALPITAPEVHREFVAGRFSIKRNKGMFNQVASDQALEHVNRIAKVSGGIIGITHINSSRDRWCLTSSERARICDDTLALFGLHHNDSNDDCYHRDAGMAGIRRDEDDIMKLVSEFNRFRVFSQPSPELINLATNDIVPDDISNEILSAEKKGVTLVNNFVESRLLKNETDFYARIPQNKPKTIATMYKVVVKKSKETVTMVKAERDIFRRLLVVKDSGRDVDLATILEHELSPVPLALAGTNQQLKPTTKAELADILVEQTDIMQILPNFEGRTCLLVDGPALIQAIGKPDNVVTFGDLAQIFIQNILSKFRSGYTRIDVLFDRYLDTSIKDGTRNTRRGSCQTIKRRIDSVTVKVPQSWKKFIGDPLNKSELASFFSSELMKCSKEIPFGCELLVAGGFTEAKTVWTSASRDVSHLSSMAEEADTRIFLHAKDACNSDYQRLVISSRDTDVLVLALAHRNQLSQELWMLSGTSRNPKYIPIHTISQPTLVLDNIIAFHSLTGCDTTSQFAGKGKRTTWKVFIKVPELLTGIGESIPLNNDTHMQAEKFVCHLYGYGELDSVNDVRLKMFLKGKYSLDSLPPTGDSLFFHLQRANYQSYIWKRSLLSEVQAPSPDGHGWTLESGKLRPTLMSLQSVPKECRQMVSCSCKTGCTPNRCGCIKSGLCCTTACTCEGLCNVDIDD